MKIHITGKGLNSAIGSGGKALHLPTPTKSWLNAIKPDFNKYFAAKDARRTSRILKMSLVAALDALGDNQKDINGIIVGTGIGCISDSEKFIVSLLKYNEDMLSPTPFIQSTHNTIAGSIALKLKIHQYNFTYSERTFSFEWCLLDALMQLRDSSTIKRFLVGTGDELTDRTYDMAEALHLGRAYKAEEADIITHKSSEVFLGEHAAFFTLSNSNEKTAYGELVFVKMLFQQAPFDQVKQIQAALKSNDVNSPDCILIGINGHKAYDKVYEHLLAAFPESQTGYYKHLCGESFTASSFAFWLSTEILEERELPEIVRIKKSAKPIRNVLILNHFRRDYLSAIFIKK